MKRVFDKPPLNHSEQVQLLQSRGMAFDDASAAELSLRHLNYYRLAAYWLPLEEDHANHRFRAGARFEDALRRYEFDRELRLLVLDAIERIEVSVRSHWAHVMAIHHGAHAHLDPALAKDETRWEKDCERLREEIQRSDEVFIRHLTNTYSEAMPPIWATCEVMTLGVLSKLYSNLGPMRIRTAIASSYQVDERMLESWLHHLSYVRNVAAHHSRLWNRDLRILPMIPRTRPGGLVGQFVPGSRRPYNTFLLLLHLMDRVSPGHTWRARLRTHLGQHADLLGAAGFPEDWLGRPPWR